MVSPIQPLQDKHLTDKGVQLFVKRDDLLRFDNQPAFCGNKWRKLKYNLREAKRLEFNTLLTFGGAYSNHLAAVAQAGLLFGFQTIGIVRGEQSLPLNPTLQYCIDCGMQIEYVNRTDYKNKEEAPFIYKLQQDFGNFYLLPEGGTNGLALKGCAELVGELQEQLNRTPDYIAVACGTGGTLAGIVAGLNGKGEAIGFSVLKGDFLQKEVARLLNCYSTDYVANWFIQNDYHFGGYAKFTPELIRFINTFKVQHAIQLDPIYTGKLFFGLYDLIRKDYFPKGSTIVAIHTGGLQGIIGFNEQYPSLIQA